jgi:hypothetical protein
VVYEPFIQLNERGTRTQPSLCDAYVLKLSAPTAALRPTTPVCDDDEPRAGPFILCASRARCRYDDMMCVPKYPVLPELIFVYVCARVRKSVGCPTPCPTPLLLACAPLASIVCMRMYVSVCVYTCTYVYACVCVCVCVCVLCQRLLWAYHVPEPVLNPSSLGFTSLYNMCT